jgi:acyl-coenzyme A thioesterase PaaI-like protein
MLSSLLGLLRSSAPPHRRPRRVTLRPAVEPLAERCLPSAGLASPLPDAALSLVALDCSQEQQVPMNLSGSGQFISGDGDFTASGKASHLGQWTNAGNVQFAEPDADGNSQVTGTVTFTAANGDTLTATITGTFNVLTEQGAARFDWTGGTGRFAHACGSLSFAIRNLPDGTFVFSGAGRIAHHRS